MPRQNLNQTSFVAGEISPLLFGGVDLSKYGSGVAYARNFYIRPHGGLFRRSGTRYVNEVKFSNRKTELIKFRFSIDQAYVLEFGHEYIRVYKNGSRIGTFEIVTPYQESEIADLYVAQSADVLYICSANHAVRTLSRFSDTVWSLDLLENEDGPYLPRDENGYIYRLSNISYTATITSTANDFVIGDVGKFVEYYKNGVLSIGEITAFVSATEVTIEPKDNVIDPLTIDSSTIVAVAPSGTTRLRSTATIWSSESEYSYIKVGGVWYYTSTQQAGTETVTPGNGVNPYSVVSMLVGSTPTMVSTSGTLSESNESITATLTSSQAIFDSSRDVGRNFRMNLSSQQVPGSITSVTNTSECEVSLLRSVPLNPTNPQEYRNNAETTDFRFGSWYVGNYPTCVTIHEQRLVFASTALEPQTLWFSSSSDYTNFSPSDLDSQVTEANAITRTIGANEVNDIMWLQSGPVLLVGTIGGEWQIKPSTINEPLTPENFSATPQTANGSIDTVPPIKVGPATLFVQRDGQTLREMVYSFELDSFTSRDLSIISEHLLRKSVKIKNSDFQLVPNQVYWAVMDDGSIVALTYERDQEVLAWHKHELGGGGIAESVVVVPSEDQTEDEVYFVVKRTVNGSEVRYIERLAQEMLDNLGKEDMVYLDCSITDTSGPSTTFSGLSHLEGEEVSVLADGAVHPNVTVTGGAITLTYSATKVQVGLAYSSSFQLLRPEGGSAFGASQGKLKKSIRYDIRLFNSLGFRHGPSLSSLTNYSFRETDFTWGTSPDLVSGDFEVIPARGYEKDLQYWFEQSEPYPLNVLSLTTTLKTNE